MTKEMLTTDEIKGLVKLVKEWKVIVWVIGGNIDDNLRVAISPENIVYPSQGYKIIAGNPNQFNIDNYGICPVLGEFKVKDDEIDDLYRGVMNKHEADYESQHNQAVENARRILREQH